MTAIHTASLCHGMALAAIALLSTPPALADAYLEFGATDAGTGALKLEVDHHHALSHLHDDLGIRLGLGLLVLISYGEKDNSALVFTPAFRYALASGGRRFLEVGVGAALFEDARMADRDLATAFQFEDRLSFGLRLRGGELGLSLSHYSNGSLKPPNDGFQIYGLSLRLPL